MIAAKIIVPGRYVKLQLNNALMIVMDASLCLFKGTNMATDHC